MSVHVFDDVANDYDDSFTHTILGRELRKVVWRSLEEAFPPGTHVLELNCGTGEDAVWLAGRGIRVLATDGSSAMLQLAADKAASNGLSAMIDFLPLDLNAPEAVWADAEFDGALSDFGGLNCVGDLAPVAGMLGKSIKPGGRLIVVVMGRWCLWEMIWHILHLRPSVAFRRLRGEADARIANGTVRVRYPSVGELRRVFHPLFALRRSLGVGVFLPPSYLHGGVTRRRRLLRLLLRLESAAGSAAILRRLGDHILLDFERMGSAARDAG